MELRNGWGRGLWGSTGVTDGINGADCCLYCKEKAAEMSRQEKDKL